MSRLRDRLIERSFHPAPIDVVFNPVYIIRRSLYKEIRSLAPRITGDVLDFGCGSKPYLPLFAHATSYIGCDLEMSGHSHRLSKVDHYYDGKSLPFADSSFDCVVSFESLEHLFNLPEILQEIRRVTRAGGLLLVSVPFAWDEHEPPYDFARYTSFGLRHLLREGGFEVLEARKTAGYVLAVFQLLIAYLMQRVAPRQQLLFALFQLLVLFPLTLLAYGLNAVLPKSDQFFCNNVMLARKCAAYARPAGAGRSDPPR